MFIRLRRIRNLDRHLPVEYRNRELHIGVSELDQHAAQLRQIGFSEELAVGERVLPVIKGPVSRFNAEGKQVVRRDMPMETAYRQVEWHWTERHGDRKVEQSDFRDVPYKRYPRDFIPPPSLELQVGTNAQEQRVVTTSSIAYTDDYRDLLIHAINLCLELFGECEIFTEDLVPATRVPVRHLNWQVLPPGRYPWERLQQAVQPLIDRVKKGNRLVISRRLELISDAGPEFVAVGRAGFTGYLVFGFPAKNLYVLESILYGNATYVFEENWEELSKMTKAQILNETLQKQRIIHREGWERSVRSLIA